MPSKNSGTQPVVNHSLGNGLLSMFSLDLLPNWGGIMLSPEQVEGQNGQFLRKSQSAFYSSTVLVRLQVAGWNCDENNEPTD